MVFQVYAAPVQSTRRPLHASSRSLDVAMHRARSLASRHGRAYVDACRADGSGEALAMLTRDRGGRITLAYARPQETANA